MQLSNWLNKPYPLVVRPKDKVILVFSFAIFAYTFLLIYQPFGAAEIKSGRSLFLAGFGLNVFLGLVINYFLLPWVLPSLFRAENWQIRKEVIYVFWSFCLIAIFNYLYNSTVGKDFAPQHNLISFLGITISVGIFPLLALVYLTETYLTKRNQSKAAAIQQEKEALPRKGANDITIHIQADTLQSNPLELAIQDFLFANSDNNYTTIFYLRDSQVERKLLRLSLKKLEDQLTEYPSLIRCHRSYIVNKDKIKSIRGNARSLNLQVAHYEGLIPVSRGFPKEKLV